MRRLIDAGVHGLFVSGSAGEGPLLVQREWCRLMKIAQEAAGDRVPVLGGVQDTSTRKVLDKIAWLRELGYRYCVVTPTFYIPTRSAMSSFACSPPAGRRLATWKSWATTFHS